MADVWAKDKNGNKRRFTQMSWDLLGKNKEGWELMEDHIIHNVANKTLLKPNTGEKPKVTTTMHNALDKEKNDGPKTDNTDNTLTNKDPKTDENKTATNNSEELENFLRAAEGIKRGDIKDFFDKQTPPVEYKQTENTHALTLKLASFFKNDVVEFQKSFGA